MKRSDVLERLLWQVIDASQQVIKAALQKLRDLSPPAVRLEASFGPATLKQPHQSNTSMITKQITNEQQVVVHFEPKTAAGHPAPLDGPITYEVLDGNSTFDAVSDDGKQATLVSEAGIGTTHIKATGDADLGEGHVEVSEIIELNVIAPNAASFGATFDEPTLKP